MASSRTYRWLDQDDIWFIAARFLAESGYADVSTFADAIRAANPAIIAWFQIPDQTVVTIPYLSS